MLDLLRALGVNNCCHLSIIKAVFLRERLHELYGDLTAGKHKLVDTLRLFELELYLGGCRVKRRLGDIGFGVECVWVVVLKVFSHFKLIEFFDFLAQLSF